MHLLFLWFRAERSGAGRCARVQCGVQWSRAVCKCAMRSAKGRCVERVAEARVASVGERA